MPIFFTALLTILLASSSFAASFHWADNDGFHSFDQITKVPLEHRKDLPVVKNRISLPFTAEENRDGAMFVWFMLGREGIDYPYIKAADFPQNPFFRQIDEPRPADVAWWKGFVALYKGEKGTLISASGDISLKTLEKKRGKAVWYRYIGPVWKSNPSAMNKAPQKAINSSSESLLRLDKAAIFPPQFNDDAERDIFRGNWEKTVAGLESLRKRYPDDPQVLRLLGVCYRMGYNLGIPGAWERAEAYLLRTEELAPEAPEAYISLGILYGDSQSGYANQAELQFRQALQHARKEQMPQIWWGLSLALYSQGKTKEAVETIDRLIALRPTDDKAKKLRETFLKADQGSKR